MHARDGLLSGRVALVTGAGRGIGRALALGLAEAGAAVVVSARTAADLDDVVAAARTKGVPARAVVADALDRDQARAVVRAALDEHGRVDVVVNNVGGQLGTSDPFDPDDDGFADTVALNLTSAWWTATAALPAMRDQGYGRIVNIGSGTAKRAGTGAAYTAAKHGLIGLTRSLAASTAADGITVNCVCPGWTNTSFQWEAVARRQGVTVAEAQARALVDTLQRRVLEPEELTAMVTLLASEDGAGITGQVISVDGGYKV